MNTIELSPRSHTADQRAAKMFHKIPGATVSCCLVDRLNLFARDFLGIREESAMEEPNGETTKKETPVHT
jgi:hypothetical protein